MACKGRKKCRPKGAARGKAIAKKRSRCHNEATAFMVAKRRGGVEIGIGGYAKRFKACMTRPKKR